MATGGFDSAVVDDAVAGRLPSRCDPCDRRQRHTVATKVCSTCQENFCDECCDLHRVFKPGEHHIKALGSETLVQSPVDMKGVDICMEHSRMFRYHCKDHDVLCCELCHIEMHRKCDDIFKIDDLVKSDPTDDLDKEMDDILVLADETIQQWEAQIQANATQMKTEYDKVDKIRLQLLNRFQEQEDNVISKMKEENEKIKHMIEEKTRVVKSVKQDVEGVISINNDVQERGSDMQKYIAKVIMKRNKRTAMSTLTDLSNSTYQEQLEPIPNSHLFALVSTDEQLFTLKRQATQEPEVDSRESNCENNKADNVVSSQRNDITRDCVSEQSGKCTVSKDNTNEKNAAEMHTLKLELLPTTKLKRTRADTKWPLIIGLDFLPDGRIVAVDMANMKCMILGSNLQRRKWFQLYESPFDVACFSNNQLAVTLQSAIVLLSVCQNSNISLKKTIHVSSRFYSISSFYIGTFLSNTRGVAQPVRIVDIEGNETVLHGQNFPNYIERSRCRFIQSKDTLVFTNSNANTVYLLNTKTGESFEVIHPSIDNPRDACEGPNGTVLICRFSSILQLTVKGEVLSSVDVGMDHLYSVSVSKDGTKLAVSSFKTRNMELRLFKIV